MSRKDELSTPSAWNPCPVCGAMSSVEANIACRGANSECGMTPSPHVGSAAPTARSEVKPSPTPWEAQWPDADAEYPDRGAAFIVGANLSGIVGAALPSPTEFDSGDFSRVWANAKLIVEAVNSHAKLVEDLERASDLLSAVSRHIECDGVLMEGSGTMDDIYSFLGERRNAFLWELARRSDAKLDEPRGLSASEGPCPEAVVPSPSINRGGG